MSTKSIHGIMRTEGEIAQAISVVSSAKNVPPKFKKYLHKYYHLHMPASEIWERNTLVHQGVIYTVVRAAGTPAIQESDEIVASFRQTKHILNCDNFCVVSIATKE